MPSTHSSIAILYAFTANLGVAAVKAGAATWTGSGSLLAEAIHSFADCGNQVLLFIGMKRSEKEATRKHPMGFGRESYIWSMMVAFILFSVGGGYFPFMKDGNAILTRILLKMRVSHCSSC